MAILPSGDDCGWIGGEMSTGIRHQPQRTDLGRESESGDRSRSAWGHKVRLDEMNAKFRRYSKKGLERESKPTRRFEVGEKRCA